MNAQTLLISGALFLLSLISLSVNRAVLQRQETSTEGEAVIVATSLAQSMVEEISMKKFDQRVVLTPASVPDSLTLTSQLGADSGEVFPNFNDVDDFNGYSRTVATPVLGDFTLKSRVWYTTSTLLGDSTSTRTFMKAVKIVVGGNPYMRDSVIVQNIVTY